MELRGYCYGFYRIDFIVYNESILSASYTKDTLSILNRQGWEFCRSADPIKQGHFLQNAHQRGVRVFYEINVNERTIYIDGV